MITSQCPFISTVRSAVPIGFPAPTLTLALNPLPTPNLHLTPTPLPAYHPAGRRNPDESRIRIKMKSTSKRTRTTRSSSDKILNPEPRTLPPIHVRVFSEYSDIPNTTNPDFHEQNQPFSVDKRKSTLTSNLNSCGVQPITPTNSIAQKRKPRITTFLPNRVGVMSKYFYEGSLLVK